MPLLILIAISFVVVVLITLSGKSKFTMKEKGSDVELPYAKKSYLMTNAEREFFFILERAVHGRYYVIPQVQLSNLVQVVKTKKWEYALRNRINRKSVDFVLFNKEYFTPQIVIELDDSSHLREDRKIRDNFVDSVLNKVGIKIIHIKTAYQYNLNEIENMLNINKKQIHILHTDDDKFILDLYKPLFEKEGYKVSSIKELAKDFIQQVINLNPDLIISDITKPDVDGINFLKSLRANEKTKNIPFVFLSNSINEKVKEETKGLGVLGYFIKNRLTPNETVGSIKTLCVNLAKN